MMSLEPVVAVIKIDDSVTLDAVVAAVLFAGTTVAAAIGSVATGSGQDWYDRLDKPSFTPPDATFGIVWTVLYVLIALAGWLTWRASSSSWR